MTIVNKITMFAINKGKKAIQHSMQNTKLGRSIFSECKTFQNYVNSISASQKSATKAISNLSLIKNVTGLSETQCKNLFEYLPVEAKENFDTLLQAGKNLGFVDRSGKYTAKSMERFLKNYDKTAYQKMIALEQNFSNLSKADFKKLLNAYQTPEKLLANRLNILRWLKCKDQLYEYSRIIEQEGKNKAQKAADEIKNIIGIEPKVRGKGIESIYDKLSRKVLNGKEINSLNHARDKIGDLVGTRLVLDDISETNIQKIVDNICSGIESGKIKVTEIHNYSNASRPYFSQEQFEQIRKAAARKGYEIPRLESEQTSMSGYVSAQMNIVHKDGTLGELQIRGKIMNKYGEIEHIPYDLRRGKNISKNNAQLEKLFEPVEDAVQTLKRNGLDKVYDDYILKCYRYMRRYETNEIKGVFQLPQMPESLKEYSILSFDNLDKIHEQANAIKDVIEAYKTAVA